MPRMCDLCGTEPADTRLREVTGWEERRTQGGANKIVFRRETGRVMGRNCYTALRLKITPGQSSLLDSDLSQTDPVPGRRQG